MAEDCPDIAWYFTEGKKIDEARRVFALLQAMELNIEPQNLTIYASAIEGYLKGDTGEVIAFNPDAASPVA